MKTKKIVSILVSAAILAGLLSACGGKQTTPATSGQTPGSASQSQLQTPDGSVSEPEDDEDYTTGDASLDNPRNQDGIGETELLVVSFGTSFNDNRRLTIGAIEGALAEAFPEYDVRRGFTAQIVIDHIQRRDGEVIDNMTQALDRAVDNEVKTLIVQPTHLMDGGHANYFIGTVEAEPSLDDVLELVKAGNYEKVVLQPMMIVAGDHANNDMAGDDEDTWKTAFEGAGYQVKCVLKGLGEYESIQQLLVDHVKDAVAK